MAMLEENLDPSQLVMEPQSGGMPNIWAEETPVEDIINPPEQDMDIDLTVEEELLSAEAMLMLTNLADKQPKEVITDLTTKVFEGYKIDLDSRTEWEELNKQIIDLIKLLVKKKTYAGDVVANIKYPLITNACIQFAARAYPEIIKGNDVVKGKVIGNDPNGLKFDRAQRISNFMSYQVLNDMEDWEEGVDQLLFTLPAIGCAFKKTYFDAIEKQHVSNMIFADDLVVNYFTPSIDRAPRITHRIYLYQNEIVSRINSGMFTKFDVAELGQATSESGQADNETPHLFLEQHRWYDLDKDGYQEPYVVTVHYETQRLVRIVPRFASDGIIRADNGKIIKINPEQYFTRFLFMPAIDGGFYGMGFGSLLLSTNSAVNTITNQLLDSGTLSNRQSGFLGRGLRLTKGKSIQLGVGEWKPVESTGDDIRKNVFPMPVREPSPVLFQLLGMLIDAGKELSGMTEILSGQSPGANVPAESVLALIEQGLQVYSAIHKRIHRSQYKEFQKLRRLNALYLDQMFYSSVLDDEAAIVQSDFFAKDFDIVPVSDPNSTTMMQRILKAKAMLELRGQGLNDQEILKRYLLSMDIEDIDMIIPKEEQENPMEQLSLQKLQLELEELSSKIKNLDADTELILAKVQTESIEPDRKLSGIINDKDKLTLQGLSAFNQMQHNDKKLGLEDKKIGVQQVNKINQNTNFMKREYGLETNNQE